MIDLDSARPAGRPRRLERAALVAALVLAVVALALAVARPAPAATCTASVPAGYVGTVSVAGSTCSISYTPEPCADDAGGPPGTVCRGG